MSSLCADRIPASSIQHPARANTSTLITLHKAARVVQPPKRRPIPAPRVQLSSRPAELSVNERSKVVVWEIDRVPWPVLQVPCHLCHTQHRIPRVYTNSCLSSIGRERDEQAKVLLAALCCSRRYLAERVLSTGTVECSKLGRHSTRQSEAKRSEASGRVNSGNNVLARLRTLATPR